MSNVSILYQLYIQFFIIWYVDETERDKYVEDISKNCLIYWRVLLKVYCP